MRHHCPVSPTPTTRARRGAALLATTLASLSLAGCGLPSVHNPDANMGLTPASGGHTTTTATTTTNPEPTPEQGGTLPAATAHAQTTISRGAAAATPQAALTHYADVWGTWTSQTLAVVQTRVAHMSLGSARDQALQAVASYNASPQLKSSHLTSATTTVGVAPGVGPAAGYWVVTTSERTSNASQPNTLAPTLHVNYAKLTRTSAGWVVSTWSPQN